MAFSVGLPSRRKKEPGIFPAAYILSSTSTVSGKKSMPSGAWDAALAVARTRVSPIRPTTAPCDCCASSPVSKLMLLPVPDTGTETDTGSPIYLLYSFQVVAASIFWGHKKKAFGSRRPSLIAEQNRASCQLTAAGAGARRQAGSPRLAADHSLPHKKDFRANVRWTTARRSCDRPKSGAKRPVPLALPNEQPPSLPHFSRNFLTPPVSGAAPAG